MLSINVAVIMRLEVRRDISDQMMWFFPHKALMMPLQPGTEYQLEVVEDGVESENNSEKVTTKCFCAIQNGDDTGMPFNLKMVQKDGYIQFQFTDNLQCEDAFFTALKL